MTIATDTCVLWVLALAIAILALYRFLTKDYTYWEKQNVKFVKPRFFFGSLQTNKPLHHIELDLYKEYGRIYGRFDGTTPILSVADPDVLKMILVKDFHTFPNHRDVKFNDPIMDNTLFALKDKAWQKVRNVVSPIFTSAKLRKMVPILHNCTEETLQKLKAASDCHEVIQCQRVFPPFIIDSIAQCTLGMKFTPKEMKLFIEKAEDLLYGSFSWRTVGILLVPKLMKLFNISLLNPKTLKYYKEILSDVFQRRRTDDKNKADFLQHVINAEKDHLYKKSSEKGELYSKSDFTLKGLSHEESIAQCATLFMAGYDATTSLISYAIYQLAIDQECQNKVYTEVMDVINDRESAFDPDALAEMKLLNAILTESLRLCPSLVRIERRAEVDYVIEKYGITVRKGMLISVPVYAMHRDPEFFPDPDVFEPKRFLDSNSVHEQFSYLPFGIGPRHCLGKRFVELSVRYLLANLIRTFRIMPTENMQVPLKIVERQGVLTADNVEVYLMPR